MMRKTGGKALFFEDEVVTSRYVIYTPSQFAKTSLPYLQETGTLKAVKSYETGRSGLNSFLFFTVVSGRGEFQYNGAVSDIGPGDCVFIDCRKPYSQKSSPDLWTLQWVHFQGTTMEGIYRKYLEHGGKNVFHTGSGGRYREILDQIYEGSGGNTYLDSMNLAEKLLNLLSQLMQETRSQQKKHRSLSKVDIRQVKDYLDLHYGESFSLEQLADLFYIDKFYLTKIFKAEYDTTINSYLNQVRITRAKELLRFSQLSVEEIGREVGIPESNYFARVFKKIEGTSPSAYRAQW